MAPEALDHRWHDVQAKRPRPGDRVVLRIADAEDNIIYALGFIDPQSGEWVITASEPGKGTIVAQWTPLPN